MPDNNALHNAAQNGNLAGVQSQIRNFDINTKGEFDQTALIKATDHYLSGVRDEWAAQCERVEVVKLLLKSNADVNTTDVSKPTMLSVHLSCFSHTLHTYFYPRSYISRLVLLSHFEEMPRSTNQHAIQCYFFLSSFYPIPPYSAIIDNALLCLFLLYLDTLTPTHPNSTLKVYIYKPSTQYPHACTAPSFPLHPLTPKHNSPLHTSSHITHTPISIPISYMYPPSLLTCPSLFFLSLYPPLPIYLSPTMHAILRVVVPYRFVGLHH